MRWILVCCLLTSWMAHADSRLSRPKHLEEFWLGLYLSSRIEAQSKVLVDHPDRQRVMDIFSRVVDQSGKGTPYSITIIKAGVANAFALPGGFLFITDKLLDLNLNDAELAFLLGHEISHVQKRHFERIQKERAKVSFLNALATIGTAILASAAHNNTDRERLRRQGALGPRTGPTDIEPDSPQRSLPPHLAPIIAGNLFGTLYLLHSQRDFEFEADLSGARLSMQAGYPLEQGIGMLEKLFYTNYRNVSFEEWTTHPLTRSRLISLKSKADSDWFQAPKSPEFVKEKQIELADVFLDIYENLPLWEAPNFIPKGAIRNLRPLLRKRALALSDAPVILRRALRLELRHELMPKARALSPLLAPHGQVYQKWLELEALGEPVDPKLLNASQQRSDMTLNVNLSQMERSTPGYHQLKHMIENFPTHPQASSWAWKKWTLEPKMELLLDEASTFLDDPARHEQAKTVIRKLSHKYGQTPWAYLKGMETIGEAIDTQHLHQILEDCEDLEELLKVQHAFPHDANIKAVVQRKQDLLDMAYRGGRLAMLSHQNARAVQQFQKILLYDAGSDREQEARDAIYRLNTLKSNPF